VAAVARDEFAYRALLLAHKVLLQLYTALLHDNGEPVVAVVARDEFAYRALLQLYTALLQLYTALLH